MAAETDSMRPAGVQQHDDAGGVVHEWPEPPDLVGGHLPAPPFGEVAKAQHESADGGPVEEVGADHLDEPPPVGGAHPQLDRRPHRLALDARQGDRGQLLVVGVDEVEGVGPRQSAAVHSEQSLGGVVGPDQPGGGIDHHNRVGEPDRHVEQAARFDHQDSIGCRGPRP